MTFKKLQMQLGGGVNDQCGYHCLRWTMSLWVKPTDQNIKPANYSSPNTQVYEVIGGRYISEGVIVFSHIHS